MTPLDPDPKWSRDLAVGTIAGLGLATFLTVFMHVRRLEGGEGSMTLVAVFGLFLSAPLVIGGLALLRESYDPADTVRVAGWVLVGSIPILLLTVLFLTFESALRLVLGDPFILLSGLVGLGGLAGLAFGLYEIELRKAKQAVQETANRLDAIISGSPIPIVALDEAGRVTMWNQAAEETFKYSAESVLGRQYPLEPPELDGEVEDHLERLEAGEELLGLETVRERRDGVRLDVEIWTSRLEDDSGNFAGVMALVPDISDRKRREQEVQVLHRVLRHNLRNDLNVIYGNANRIEESLSALQEQLEAGETAAQPTGDASNAAVPAAEPGPALAETVPDALEYAEVLERKVSDLIDMTEKAQRAETILRSVEDEHHSVEIGELLTRSIEDLARQYPEARIEMEREGQFEILVNGPVEVAIRELVENAILHTDFQAPLIELRAYEDGERACIEVHDEGPGIPTEERQVITQGEESAMLHSSGLGLWLANWLVNRTGGSLAFEENESGTTAVVSLPLADSTPGSD